MHTERNTNTQDGRYNFKFGPVMPGALRDLGRTDGWMIDRWTVRKKTGWQNRLKKMLQYYVTAWQAARDRRRWEHKTWERRSRVVSVWLQTYGQWTESHMPVNNLSKVILDTLLYLHYFFLTDLEKKCKRIEKHHKHITEKRILNIPIF